VGTDVRGSAWVLCVATGASPLVATFARAESTPTKTMTIDQAVSAALAKHPGVRYAPQRRRRGTGLAQRRHGSLGCIDVTPDDSVDDEARERREQQERGCAGSREGLARDR
jgi:hypothetical protein